MRLLLFILLIFSYIMALDFIDVFGHPDASAFDFHLEVSFLLFKIIIHFMLLRTNQ